MPYTTYRSLAEHPSVHELIAAEIERVNARFARVEKRPQVRDSHQGARPR